jgi:hypothetical protein
MSQKYKLKKKFRKTKWEELEIEIELPYFCKYCIDCGTVFIKIDEHLNETNITIYDDCVDDYGNLHNSSYKIEFEKPHKFGYSLDIYEDKSSTKEEYMDALALMWGALERIE